MYSVYRHAAIVLFMVALLLTVHTKGVGCVDWHAFAAFALFSIICELLPVRSPGRGVESGETTLGFAIIWASGLLWGPIAATVVGVVGCVPASLIGFASCHLCFRLSSRINTQESEPSVPQILGLRTLLTLADTWFERKDYPLRWVTQLVIFNACQQGLVACTASLTYVATGGVLLARNSAPLTFWTFGAPFAAGVVVYFLFDTVFYAVGCAIWEPGNSYKKTLGDFVLRSRMMLHHHASMSYPSYVILAPFALILAYLHTQVGSISLAAVILPFYAMRYAFALTVEQVTMYRDTITTLGTYMQHYHPYTRGHLKRVAEMSERLARELKLPTNVIMLMPDAGMLHDIGKVAVPEDILDKIEKLTNEEWERIKEHPVKGADIVSHLEFLDRIVSWVKYHHKWYNGSGYPDDGVSEIPIEAAIIAVADAFDAMTDDRELTLEWVCDTCGYKPDDDSRPTICPKCGTEKHRSYRKPLSLEQALDELRRGAGSQFHPDVVRAFLRVILNDQMERQRLALDEAA